MAKGYLQDVCVVDFYQRPIITAYSDEVGYVVPMKHIVEDHLGLDWTSMRKKINRTSSILSEEGKETEVSLFNPITVSGYDLNEGLAEDLKDNLYDLYPEEDIPEFSNSSEYLCLPVSEINLFLAQININNVNVEAREALYLYQKECGAALHDYWFHGMSINSRSNPSRVSSDRHDWCPRALSSQSLAKGAARYSAFAQRHFDDRVNPEEIESFAKAAISDLLDLESDQWDSQEGTVPFILAFLERAAFDILYFSIERNVAPTELVDVLERNLANAWQGMGSLIISVQAPYNPFPGVGRGSPRTLV